MSNKLKAKENYKKRKNTKKKESMTPVIIAGICIFVFAFLVTWLLVSDDTATNPTGMQSSEETTTKKTEPKVVQYDAPKSGETIAQMHIKDYGVIKIRLFDEITPKAVKNFVEHAKAGYYDGVSFHRVIENFMIQGGDPTGTGAGGESIYGSAFEDEISPQLFPVRGALCMANAGTNTNGSQFFIVTQTDYNEQYAQYYKNSISEEIYNYLIKEGGCAHLYGKHTVFGHVYEGMDIADEISKTKTDKSDKPVDDVIIEKIEILQME